MARILVVDDSPTIVALLTAMLGREGHRVETLPSFVHLPIYLRQTPPDLVVLDLEMPTMSGLAFGQFIRRQQHREIPIIVYTAGSAEVRKDAARKLNAHSVAKNEPPSAIIRLVSQLSEERAAIL